MRINKITVVLSSMVLALTVNSTVVADKILIQNGVLLCKFYVDGKNSGICLENVAGCGMKVSKRANATKVNAEINVTKSKAVVFSTDKKLSWQPMVLGKNNCDSLDGRGFFIPNNDKPFVFDAKGRLGLDCINYHQEFWCIQS